MIGWNFLGNFIIRSVACATVEKALVATLMLKVDSVRGPATTRDRCLLDVFAR